MSAKNFMSYGDAETVFTAIANAIKNNEDAVAAVTSALAAIKDGSELDSFGDVEVALLDKADNSDLGTAAAKDSTNSVTSGSTDLVESGAVKDAIDAAVAAAYHHAGTKTVAQLTHDLLIAANEGNVYNITDSGTTTSDFIEGIGKQIDAGDNVGICKVGNVYMFDLLSGLEDTSLFVQKSQTSGLLKNDGTVNTTIEDTVAEHTTAITAIKDGTDIDNFGDVETALDKKADTDIVASDFSAAASYTAGDYCIYEGKFYKFKTSHSGAWSAADVDEIKIAGELSSLKSGLTNLVKVYNASGTTDAVGDFIFSVPNNGTLLYVRPLRDAEYYNVWWGVILASTSGNVGHSAKAIKDDNTPLTSQAVKFDVYYI